MEDAFAAPLPQATTLKIPTTKAPSHQLVNAVQLNQSSVTQLYLSIPIVTVTALLDLVTNMGSKTLIDPLSPNIVAALLTTPTPLITMVKACHQTKARKRFVIAQNVDIVDAAPTVLGTIIEASGTDQEAIIRNAIAVLVTIAADLIIIKRANLSAA